MRQVNISTLKNNLSAILATLEHEGSVVVTDRDRPVAELRRIPVETEPVEAKLAELERAGIIRRPARRWTPDSLKEFLDTHQPARPLLPVDMVQGMVEEREAGW